MVKSFITAILLASSSLYGNGGVFAFSMSMRGPRPSDSDLNSRRSFLSTTAASVTVASLAVAAQPQPSIAATAKEIITSPSGIKYAVTKQPTDKKPVAPLKGDIVAIEYTGYLTNGQRGSQTRCCSNSVLDPLSPDLRKWFHSWLWDRKFNALFHPISHMVIRGSVLKMENV
mmetsp:Transcript_26399/g.54433  ORF Transcript_26399/g.54433 Transcript_26399/m.54433 type:complete len:172 (-) Transcript_26399:1398-1913(-)